MEKLPKELLIEIFDYLPSKDILTTMLVSKSFNNIISDSVSLRKKFRLNLHARRIASKEWIGSRQYSRVIMRDSSKKSLDIMKNIAKNITELRLMFGRMYMKSLKKIFLRAKNLKDVSIVKMDFIDSEDDFKGELPILSLNSLNYNGNKNLFRLLRDCSIKKLSVYSVYNTPDEIFYFKTFLKSQNSLEILEFTSFDQEWMLFDDEHLSEVNFKLKKLSIHNFKVFDLKFFKLFLLLHKTSLEELTLNQEFSSFEVKSLHEELFESLGDFNKLKSLNLLSFTIPNSPFPLIRALTIQKVPKINFDEICNNFLNLETLNIFSCKELKADLSTMRNLKVLMIESSKILSLKLPSLKRITLSDMSLQYEIFENNNFTEVLIDNCEELVHIINFLKNPETKLNLLKIESCQIKKSEIDLITSISGSKIKNLILAHCNENFNKIELKKMKTT